jgi:hypothetical protein
MSQTIQDKQVELTHIFCQTNNMLANAWARTAAGAAAKLGNPDTQRDMAEAKVLLDRALELYCSIIDRERVK